MCKYFLCVRICWNIDLVFFSDIMVIRKDYKKMICKKKIVNMCIKNDWNIKIYDIIFMLFV